MMTPTNRSGDTSGTDYSADSIDQRLRRAAVSGAPGASDFETVLDPDQLATRKVSVVSPRARQAGIIGGLTGGLATVAALALVTTTALQPPGPLFTLAQGASPSTMSAESADTRIAMWVEYVYTVSEELSREPGRGEVFQLELDGTPQSVLSNLGQILEVPGDPHETEYFDPNYPTYVVGSEDWTAPSVMISWSGTGSWWYSNPQAYPEPVCTEVTENDQTFTTCDQPPPSGPLPTNEEAQALAADIFSQTGLDVTASDVKIQWSDEWGIYLSASLVVDGTPTALEWAMSITPGPQISSVSGHSVKVTNRGTFDTISAYDAVDRLDEGIWWGSPGPEFFSATPMAAETRSATEPLDTPLTDDTSTQDPGSGTSNDEGTERPAEDSPSEPAEPTDPAEPGDGIEVLPAPDEEMPWPTEPEVVEVTVLDATSTLLLVYDQAGGAWLVPGFVMNHDGGWWVSVISLIEGVIELPDPSEYGIMPLIEPRIEPGIEQGED